MLSALIYIYIQIVSVIQTVYVLNRNIFIRVVLKYYSHKQFILWSE
jgi:hypothetical protein